MIAKLKNVEFRHTGYYFIKLKQMPQFYSQWCYYIMLVKKNVAS